MKVIAGRDKGKVGEITEVFKHNSKVIVKEINLKTKHVKSREEEEKGQIIKVCFCSLQQIQIKYSVQNENL